MMSASANKTPTGSVTVNGFPGLGQTLTASNTLADADGLGLISYQWKADDVLISGATGDSFTVTAEQVGKKITVVASYTDQKGVLESVSSDVSYLKTSYELAQPKQWLQAQKLVDLTGSRYIKDGVLNVMQTAQLDLNNDGLDDLITYSSYPLDIPTPNPPPVIFINNGELLQQVPWTGVTPQNPHGVKILVGDFNGDKLPDLFSLVDIDQPFGAFPSLKDFNHLLINSPSGFTKAVEFEDMPGYWCAGASGDIDGDGDLDVVMFNFHVQNNKVQSQILWNDGNAIFTFDSRGIGDIPIVDIAEFRDVNRDGYLDLVIDHIALKSVRTPIVSVMWGDGSGFSLSNSTDFILPNDAYVGDICFADLNADGFDEILIGGVNDVGVFWFRIYQSKDKGATFQDVSYQLIDFNTSTVGFSHLYVTDIDQDGFIDVFSPNQDDAVHWEWNGTQFIKQNTPVKGDIYLVFNSVKQGDQLLAVANLSDVDGLGTFSYQWFRGITEIKNSNSANYTLTQADVNQTVSVKVSFTDARGHLESMSSAASPKVDNVNDAPLGNITLSGQFKQGQTLNAVSTLSDLDGMGAISYQWKADGLNIQDATSSSLLLSQSQVGKMISLSASYTDGMGSLENIITPPSGPVLAAPSLSGQIYQWKSHTLLSGVVIETNLSSATSTTNDSGAFSINELPVGNVQLKSNLALTSLETGNAINSADALAALKIAVGRSPNADGSPASPYQLIAADVNQDGKVTSADALAILKMAVKRSDAPAREWLFVNESQDFWDESANNGQGGLTISRTNVTWNKDPQAAITQDTTLNLVAVLKGDVNGSWTGPTTGTQSLPTTYYSDLVKKGLGPLSTWGVVAA